ncbi:MAG: endolytic transglycosylase MltG [Candidatus Thioglobus sp.]|jgi:aminodeoxychorismate lyase|uniref:endolytic transglycosylase MltG n=1 Tax=Candidatus Thioglobus sp. TaxID=2026721 RepID=UPI0025BEB48B|nr:endolytic transglycosylase MltG [Candidatus Thioglobus sp.]MBT3276786.1 endolytic transglycosylase MltG [Candidatus Thioglobus sp.]
MSHVILINGKKQTKLSVFNRLVQFGDGLFETCMAVDQRLLLAEAHFQRLEKGAKRLKIIPISRSILTKEIAKAVSMSKLDRAVVKVILSRGESARGYGYDKSIAPTRIIIVSSVPDLPQTYTLSLCDSGYATNQLLSEIKHCNRLEQILARTHLKTQECIMLDPQAQVVSVTQGNIFAIKNGVLLTPGLSECGIEGTRRQAIIELARKQGLSVEVCCLSVAELLACDEVFISNSVMGIRPISQINEQKYSQHQITDRLIEVFNQHLLKRGNSALLKPKKNPLKIWAIVFLALFTAWAMWANKINILKPTVYQLPQGANIYSTADNLKRYGLVNSSQFVVWAAKVLGASETLKSGHYELTPDTSVLSLLDDFSNAHVATRKITLVEGQTVQTYFQMLSQHQALTTKLSFEKTLQNTNAKPPYDGQFWPDTYQVNYADSVLSVLNRSHALLQEKLSKAWDNRAKDHLLKNKNQLLILASLVEKETANHAEKAKIAGVFINRLKKGMRLQTDPTVVYALGDAYTGKLSKQDLWFKSPYNTYRHKGLPPGPIGSVGLESLKAAAQPLKSDFLYFVSKKDGTHAFAKTYKQHLINIKKHLK